MKRYKVDVIVETNDEEDFNDAIGGLCDIIRDGLMQEKYDYLTDIRVGDFEIVKEF